MISAASPVLAKLSVHDGLSSTDKSDIERAMAETVRSIDARFDISREGEPTDTIKFVLSGWVARYKQSPDGRRQILGLMIAGDIADANAYVLRQTDHALASITPVEYAEVPVAVFDRLMTGSPRIARALWRSEHTTAAIQRQWTANVGQRQAQERIAHLLCEMHLRQYAIGLAGANQCEFPLTQNDIAEATGLTSVHVNRMLQALRKDGLIALRSRMLQMPDVERLRKAASFDPSYLYL